MEWDIAYNTSKDELIYSEYGRNVQELLQKANEIENADDRQSYVERVLKLMLQMQPSVKQQENYEERLWKHAFRIAGGELNVIIPDGINATPDAEGKTPEPLPYPDTNKRMLHYGKNVLRIIEEGKKMEDGPERDLVTYTAAYYMKVALTDWRDGKFYNEDMIRKDLYELSDKVLVLPKDAKIGEPTGNQPSQDNGSGRRKKKKKKSSGNSSSNSNRSSSSRNRGSRNRRRR
ncbi:uncharacterized protein DUF4290 [Neolewinella xylanilytica]|uniref:Uncharacterized protein DUF4290 n=1 Tax=Neolewinella xylanilytica TaxID=1514080 RepID=A0A2S6I4G8_9BACT|nr:DUF4290 domain-containing protein [Neolewinella xylanilytica]PPK85969.1 uncharacterized protein DUF4290 [Neolewinella xylanilytica]